MFVMSLYKILMYSHSNLTGHTLKINKLHIKTEKIVINNNNNNNNHWLLYFEPSEIYGTKKKHSHYYWWVT